MSVLCLKLTTGEEIIGDISPDRTSDTYVVENPAYIQLMPKENGMSINMGVPFLPYAKGRKFRIPMTSVIVEFEPTTEMRNAYSTQYGSGVVLAEPNQIDPKTLLLG